MTALIRSVLPAVPKLVAIIGLLPGDQVADLGQASDEIVDLDQLDMGAALEQPESGVVVVIARTTTDLQRAASLSGLLPKATHLIIGIVQAPVHRPLALPAISPGWPTLRSLQARRGSVGDWLVEASFSRALPAGEFLVAAVRGLAGHRIQTLPPPRIALAGAGAAHWRPGDPGAPLAHEGGPLSPPDQFLVADLVFRSVRAESAPWSDERVAVVDRLDSTLTSWTSLGAAGGMSKVRSILTMLSDPDSVPPVDERSVSPTGFIGAPELGIGVLSQAEGHWSVRINEQNIARFHPSGAVTDADVAALRQLRAVSVQDARFTGPNSAVRLLAGLAAAGVPLFASRIPPWAQALGTEVIDLITKVDQQDLADDLLREEYSIRLRRAALRTHSTRARWRNMAAATGFVAENRPKVSVILCTRRADFIEFALRQISRQRDVELELVLVLHGMPADQPKIKSLLANFERPTTVVEAPSGEPFGLALNRGVERASGQYIAKWDDDDWYSPDFLADMLLAHSYSGADLVGCLSQLVYLEQIDLTVLRRGGESERESRYISGGTLVMHRHVFDAVAGFRPLRRHVDTGLLRAIAAAGGRIYRTHGLGYMLHRRPSGHTWVQPVTTFLRASSRQWRGFRPSALIEADEVKPTANSGRGKDAKDA